VAVNRRIPESTNLAVRTHPSTRTRRGTSRRLEETALELFYERGSKATTVRDITKACDITPGALYRHFSSKEGLLFAIIKRQHERFLAVLDEALLQAVVDPVKRLSALVEALVLFHTQNRKEVRVGNQELERLPQPMLNEILELRRAIRARFQLVLADGVQSGVFELARIESIDPTLPTAMAICDLGIRAAEWFRTSHTLTSEEIAALHVELALRMVKAV